MMWTTAFLSSLHPTAPLTLVEYLHKALPLSCELGVVLATGIIGTVETAYQGHWLECAQNMNQEILDFLEGTDEEDAAQCQPAKRIRKDGKLKNEEETKEKPKKVSDPWKSNVGYSIEVEQYSPAMLEADAVSVLVIPHHPGVNVKFFSVSPQKFYSDFVSLAQQCCQIRAQDLLNNHFEFTVSHVISSWKCKQVVL